MFTNTNIHDELGDDFTGATAMSNAEVKIALAHNRAQAPNKKRQSETFVRAEKHTKRVAQSNVIQIVNAQNHDGDTALCFATEISTMLLCVNLRDGRYREAAPGWLCVNQRSAVAAALREAGENQLAAAAAAALPDTPPHYR